MDKHLTRMHALLKAGLSGVGVADRQVRYDPAERAFALGESGVVVAFETPSKGRAQWRVKEIYLFADVKEGGEHPIGATVAEIPVMQDVLAARTAILHMVQLRVDASLDAVA